MIYKSNSGNSDESSNIATDTKEEARNNGCRDEFFINKLNNSKSNIKEHKLSSDNLDKALHNTHLLKLRKSHLKWLNKPNSKINWNIYI